MLYRYFLRLQFQGENYCGWQLQPNGNTVQAEVEKALFHLLGLQGHITGCGRTDAGVGAWDYYAHFDMDKCLSAHQSALMVSRLNAYLPADIAVKALLPVQPEAHARFSASARTYTYRFTLVKSPFERFRALLIPRSISVERMEALAKLLLGRHDFKCFSKVHTQVNNYYCEVVQASFSWEGEVLVFTITADRFLRNMVRAVVGTLLEAGKGKLDEAGFLSILDSHDRCKAGTSVPAKGLALSSVSYPESIFLKEPVPIRLPHSPDEQKSHDDTEC